MSPQRPRSYPDPGDEFSRIDMTRAEGKAIRDGNTERRAAWERRQAIISHPAFHMGQGASRHDPVWGEQHRGNMRPIEHGPDIPHRLAAGVQDLVQDFAAGAKEAFTDAMRLIGEPALTQAKVHQALGRESSDTLERLKDFAQWQPPPFRRSVKPPEGVPYVDNMEPPDPTSERGLQKSALGYTVGGDGSFGDYANDPASSAALPRGGQPLQLLAALRTRPGGFAGGYSALALHNLVPNLDELRTTQQAQAAAGREQAQVALESSRALTEAAYGVDAFGTSAETSTLPVRHLTDGAAGLGEQFVGLNSLVEATPGYMQEVNAAFDATAHDQLPELIGQMGALEYQTLAAVDAFGQLAGAPRGSPPAGGTSGGGSSARPYSAELQAFLDTPPPSNLAEIFLDQFRQGHDMSGFQDAHHWWEKHLEHVAQLKAAGHAFAQGTAFAPGGMALVGEMRPELVNLPRGSQVIPNPQLGSEVTVNVNVEGSVVAERDLAQRIRQELIRTSRRTLDLGFVA